MLGQLYLIFSSASVSVTMTKGRMDTHILKALGKKPFLATTVNKNIVGYLILTKLKSLQVCM